MRIYFIALLLLSSAAFSQTSNWSLVGPNAFPVNLSGQINGIGRVCQVKFHPVQDSIIYAASASGGLFISRDNGTTWIVTGTDQLPRAACASICIDYTNDSVLYLSTGDPNYYGTDYGIYKSTDGGATWNASNTGIGNRMALEMLMDPTDNLVIVAATNDGIWKTIDGGLTWIEKKNSDSFTDMVYKPVNGTTVIYAASTNGFWISQDMGETWNQLTIPIPLGGNADGIRIGVSAADTNKIYLGVIYYDPTTHYGTIYRSDDGGQTFTGVKTQLAPDIAGYNATSQGQGNYNWTIVVDPLDANVVYTGSHCVWKSIDAGVTWTKLTDWYAELHTDMHQLLFNPYGNNELWEANDGGVWVSTNSGINWSTKCDGISATENYHAAQSPGTRQMISIGTQDNGELFFSSNGWFTNRGGDWGSRMIFDYLNPTVTYYYENGKRRSQNGSEEDLVLPFAPTNNSEFAFTPLNNQVGYTGYDNIYRTTDLGSSPPTWNIISSFGAQVKALAVSRQRADQIYVVTSNNKIYRCDNALDAAPVFNMYNAPATTSVRANITTVASDSNVVYLSCGSKIYKSADKGQTWTNITGGLPSVNVINLIDDPFSNNESVYAATAKSVWYKNDTMATWLNYSSGLPTIADMQDLMMYNNGTSSNVLRVGYYGRGVWESPLFDAAAALPDPLFVADTLYGCPGITVQFTDFSTGNPLSWSWDFPGGTPATSIVQNPLVNYTQGGIHDVTLTVTNVNGSKSYTRYSYITILGPTVLPLQEGFEGTAFLPPGWIMYSATGDGAWQHSNNVGGYSLSSKSAFFDNYNTDLTGKRYAMRTQAYDLTNTDSALVFFDVAYSQYDNVYSDTLLIYASTDCGQTWIPIYNKGGATLATAPNLTSSGFIPASFEWRTDSIWLDQFAGFDMVQLSFENKAAYGQNMYVDNINFKDPNSVGLNEIKNNIFGMSAFPNPAVNKSTLKFVLTQHANCLIQLFDADNKLVKNIAASEFSKGENLISLDLDGLRSGVYLLSIVTEKIQNSIKLEVR